MTPYLRRLRNFFVSLQLTVVLLVMSAVLIFAATLAQRHLGIWEVQQRFFRSFLVFWQFDGSETSVPLFPGGYLIGGALLINLISAHIYRFKLTWKKVGIQLAHSGLIVLLLGELISGLLQRDSSMRLEEGETRKYSESFREYELALLDKTNPGYDDVVAIPEDRLTEAQSIQHPKLPFRVTVKAYYPNVAVQMRDASASGPNPATMGIGTRVQMLPQPPTYQPDEVNMPGAYVEIAGTEGPLGTWLVSPQLGAPQTFAYQGHNWEIVLRLKRYYRPFALTLLKVRNDIYPGTDIPKNFSSRIRLKSDNGHDDRDVLIYMNNPLRYGGATFYQYQMNAAGHLSVLEVVHNPGWILPYIACGMMALGLAMQFGQTLVGFVSRRGKDAGPRPAAPTRARTRAPWIALGLALALVAFTLRPPATGAFDLAGFGRIPVLSNGRIKPLDTVARSSLLALKGNQDLDSPEGSPLTPVAWLADVLFAPDKADTYAHFRIDHQEVLDLLGLTSEQGVDRKYFSFNQVRPKLGDLDRQAQLAEGVDEPERSAFQKQLLTVREHIVLYLQLKFSAQVPESSDFQAELQQFNQMRPAGIAAVLAKKNNQPHDEDLVKAMREIADRFSAMEQVGTLRFVPPAAGDADPNHWRTAGSALIEGIADPKLNETVLTFARLGHAWRARDTAMFNRDVGTLTTEYRSRFPAAEKKSSVEARFNAAQPFYTSMILYVAAFLLALVSWLKWPVQLGRAAFTVMGVAFLVATAGILTRMWLEGRPPITNLYSSALYVGWLAVLLCLVLERTFRNGIGVVAGGLIGFATLLISYYLSLGGDTLEMMRAVLDSNFWLATHVVTVATGYGSTFLAGFLALIYVFRGLFSPSLDRPTADALTRMVYGIVCFATLFSFVGTVLGGIWADQSWGRFWGWDPKENGALIIVLWNATILHARWGRLVAARGLMVMAIIGNIATSWSWFGVNMLGIGLHSYGFMESTFYTLIAFVASQLLVIGLALTPLPKWRSAGVQVA
ncbi:MAG TPA: cytochrome c biogenesis protein CcsA [Candidatus Didemnitutus sp.]|jgi:ABC-type transport system involved in cytochrome c biogenesis permease subunit